MSNLKRQSPPQAAQNYEIIDRFGLSNPLWTDSSGEEKAPSLFHPDVILPSQYR